MLGGPGATANRKPIISCEKPMYMILRSVSECFTCCTLCSMLLAGCWVTGLWGSGVRTNRTWMPWRDTSTSYFPWSMIYRWGHLPHFFENNIGGHKSFVGSLIPPCFGLLVTSPLGFKARVGRLIHAWYVMHIPWDPPLVRYLPTYRKHMKLWHFDIFGGYAYE